MSAEATVENRLGEGTGEMLEDTPWFADPKYDRFWAHYYDMKAWMSAHNSVQGAEALQDFTARSWLQLYQQYYQNYQWWIHCHQRYQTLSTPPYHPPSPYGQSQHTLQSHDEHQEYQYLQRSRHPNLHHQQWQPSRDSYRANCKYINTDQSDVDHLENGISLSESLLDDDDVDADGGARGRCSQAGGEEEEEEEFEVELSEEMHQFFLQSQKHREELREMRLELSKKRARDGDGGQEEEAASRVEAGSVQLDYEDEFVAKCPGSKKSKKKLIVGAPSEQPGKRRSEEMKILYGKDSPAIHGMETAIQMQFDRNCDRKQPSHWPTVPLKM